MNFLRRFLKPAPLPDDGGEARRRLAVEYRFGGGDSPDDADPGVQPPSFPRPASAAVRGPAPAEPSGRRLSPDLREPARPDVADRVAERPEPARLAESAVVAAAAPASLGAGSAGLNGGAGRLGEASRAGAPTGALRRMREVWAVGGGKGGIGKSLITTSLGICLARAGCRVILVDADLGGANLHTCLGLPEPKVTLSDFVTRRVQAIDEIVIKTSVPNLSLISGAQDFLAAANLNYVQKTMLLRRIGDLDADIVLLDLGAGTAYNTLDFFLIAGKGIVVAVPEPTSIENCYRFIKSAFYRRLRRVVSNPSVKRLIEAAMDQKNALGIRTPHDLLTRIAEMDPAVGELIRREVSQFRPKIIMNQARTRADVEIGEHMRSACRKYFGIEVDYLGAIDYDDLVWQSVRRREPLLVKHPGSVSARSVERIAARLLQGA